MVADWNAAFKPFFDGLEQYCEDYTIGECNQRRYELG
jgi:ribosomal protein L2